jgi:chromate transporter
MTDLQTRFPPPQSYRAIFLRFLRFGLLAWGGPVAQIAMIRHELVEEERWITRERFNRVLAVYQVLPGPEATELCVYFGMIARGRLGALLAGLGFILPGFILMFGLAWLYATLGLSPLVTAFFAGCQPAVTALITRATHRIGQHALTNRARWIIAGGAALAQLLGAHFAISLLVGGLAGIMFEKGRTFLATSLVITLGIGALIFWLSAPGALITIPPLATAGAPPTLLALFGVGLRGGLLTFGGAYTAIPFFRQDAVIQGRWLTDAQFLDGLALSGILPAPLIIFSTFMGYLGGGALGAVVMTIGVFAPAFLFTLIGHDYFERLVENKATHAFLDGVTASVVGLIAATVPILGRAAIANVPALLIFGIALIVLYRWKARSAVAVVVLGAGLIGLFFF